ncbi:MAG TPA: hypothetical protein VM939_14515 [Gemmatimonadaceae bacterium]|nr:hypothetical protein [Gemmatimonadaceae bacterium]
MNRHPLSSAEESSVVQIIRKALLVILAIGLGGTLMELLLLEHTDGFWQIVPVVLLGLGLLALGAHVALRRSVGILRSFQAMMTSYVLSGLTGVFLHYSGNVEFEVERDSALAGFDLFREAMMGATPALAPGAMVQLGLIGLAYTLRHPLTR